MAEIERFGVGKRLTDFIVHGDKIHFSGYVAEEAHLYTYLTGPEYLELVGQLRGLSTRALREKIGAARDYIETVRGVGYRFADTPLVEAS